jgi:ATP sulfurylase
MAKLMKELGYMKEKKAMVIRCDDQGAMSLSKNLMRHTRTKHINVQHHFVRERVENGEIIFEYCSIEDMVANVLTKALPEEQQNKLITMFGLKTS